MGSKSIEIQLPSYYKEDDVRRAIISKLQIKQFDYKYELKSLDARKKSRIVWNIRLLVSSEEIKNSSISERPKLEIPFSNKSKPRVIIVGSGPAGFFCAFVLQKAGFSTCILEKGTKVEQRADAISLLDKEGKFDPLANYCIGEGGAGTFSDGKLTSRTKSIALEKEFMFSTYVEAGAPEEILYLSHPHIGSNRLREVVLNLRKEYLNMGGEIHFNSEVLNLKTNGNEVSEIELSNGQMETPLLVFAPGNSSYSSYRMLIKAGVSFSVKPFALGFRAEHPQSLINQAQWGKPIIEGLQSAEYFLTASVDQSLPVYTFCMCPGGRIINASAENGLAVVNGMSNFERNGQFANAAVVAAFDLCKYKSANISALEAIEWLEKLEQSYFSVGGSFAAPSIKIKDFLSNKTTQHFGPSSFPHGLVSYNPNEYMPNIVNESIRKSIALFKNKIPGYDEGVLIGLESKTSSIIRAERSDNGANPAFKNLYICGEGSGFAGGITSSGADGIKTAMSIIRHFV